MKITMYQQPPRESPVRKDPEKPYPEQTPNTEPGKDNPVIHRMIKH